MAELRKTIIENPSQGALLKQMEEVEKVANKWLKPYPNAAFRENVEVLLVALAVAMGIRTFFLQPFKIPTGSMQPTLFGVTSFPEYGHGFEESSSSVTNLVISTGWQLIRECFKENYYLHVLDHDVGT